MVRPTFEGSDRYRVRPLPVLTVNWRDTISFGEGGLSAQLRRGGLRIGGGLTFDGGRKDHDTGGLFSSGDDRLAGMGDIDFALGFRGFASYRLGIFDFSASATKFLGDQNDGVLASFGISAPMPLSKKLIIIPSIRASWADDKYMQTYFGVSALQASRSIFPRFDAHAGFQDVRGGVNLIYNFNRHWFAGANASVSRLTGDSAASPISISNTSNSAVAMIGYRF
jgi:outer membrane scaffolding protein for murein synthesis (MipA/OmpV family)